MAAGGHRLRRLDARACTLSACPTHVILCPAHSGSHHHWGVASKHFTVDWLGRRGPDRVEANALQTGLTGLGEKRGKRPLEVWDRYQRVCDHSTCAFHTPGGGGGSGRHAQLLVISSDRPRMHTPTVEVGGDCSPA